MTNPGPIPEVDVDELARLASTGAVVVDVRMPDEYHEAHVPGAMLIPLPELTGRTSEIPRADVVYVVCRSGVRSLKACQFLAGDGRPAANVAGGTVAWVEAGHPVATGSAPG